MDLKRNIYKKLLEWKEDSSRTTLEVSGARQVGKTYLINKFADECFKRKIYINLFELSGKQFMECYKKAVEWTPGNQRPLSPLKEAFRLYEPGFVDDEETVIIIDEIQESSEIYNRIREFTRQFRARFIVTGSYLGRTYDPDFRFSSGDVTKLVVYTLSFDEFLQAYDMETYEKYRMIREWPLDEVLHKRLGEIYDIYCQIGGYPKVVENYIQNHDMEKAEGELVRIIDTFTNESIRYFTDILDTAVFTQIFLSICRILNREKKGLAEDSISEGLQKLVKNDYSSNISKATCNRAISWLKSSGIIGFCGKITELDILNFKAASRCYFMDCGLANYYLRRTGTDPRELAGTLNETYVYINLSKRIDHPAEIAFESPAFAVYKGGEIDFVVQGLKTGRRYLLEVKSGKGDAPTAKKALEQGKADRLLYLKRDTRGGTAGKTDTLPIYLLEQYQF